MGFARFVGVRASWIEGLGTAVLPSLLLCLYGVVRQWPRAHPISQRPVVLLAAMMALLKSPVRDGGPMSRSKGCEHIYALSSLLATRPR